MFTGVIETVGRVVGTRTIGASRRLTIDAASAADGAVLGASVAVNGVCLTVCEIDGTRLDFDVVAETLDRSDLGSLQVGHHVNLERSLRAGDRLDGHFVQGHIDGIARITHKQPGEREHVVEFEPDDSLRPYIVPKGSIAIDGISLTIADVSDRAFRVALIPATVARTTLWGKPVGDVVNVESDILVRSVVHWLQSRESGAGASRLTLAKLQEHGFA